MKQPIETAQGPVLCGPLAALVFAMVFPSAATWVWFVLLSGQGSMKLVFAAAKLIQFGFPVVCVLAVQHRRIRLERPRADGIGVGLFFGLVVVGAMFGLYYGMLRGSSLLADAPAAIADRLRGFGVDSAIKFVGLAAFYSLAHSFLEEYYWRWFVYGELRARMSVAAAIAVSSLGFMAHHVIVIGQFFEGYGLATWFFSLCVAVGGAVWAWIYHRTRTLYGPWASHLVVDAGIMWVGYDLWQMVSP